MSNAILKFLFGESTSGLLGNNNSHDYRLAEVERHFHSYESWFGAAASPSGETHIADRIDAGIDPLQIDAGTDDWGSWTQILGSSDTPARDTNPKFELHRLSVVEVENAGAEHFLQIAFGATGAGAYSAGDFTETVFFPVNATPNDLPPVIELQCRRVAAATKVWARLFVDGAATSTMDFFLGIHEYEG